MPEEVVELSLFRCYHCRVLLTAGELEEHKGCPKCNSNKIVLAQHVTNKENKRLEKMYLAGKLQLHLTGANPNG